MMCLVLGDEIRVEPEMGDAGAPAENEILGHRIQDDENDIDQTVIVAGVGHTIRTVIVEQGEVDVPVGILKDFGNEVGVTAMLSSRPEVVAGSVSGLVASCGDLSSDLQGPERHGVVKVTETARPFGIENIPRPFRYRTSLDRLPFEFGENGHGASCSCGVLRRRGLGAGSQLARGARGGRMPGCAGAQEDIRVGNSTE